METTVNPAALRKAALNNALIWAVISLALFLIVFYVKPDLMGSFTWNIVQFLVGIGLAVWLCLDLRKKAGGYWTFREALSHIFLMFFVQAIIVFFFTILFAKIEPSFVDKMKAVSQNATVGMLEKMGMDQDKIDEALKESEMQMEKQFNPGIKEILVGIGTVAIMYFIGALIFAAIFKKDPPVFREVKSEE